MDLNFYKINETDNISWSFNFNCESEREYAWVFSRVPDLVEFNLRYPNDLLKTEPYLSFISGTTACL